MRSCNHLSENEESLMAPRKSRPVRYANTRVGNFVSRMPFRVTANAVGYAARRAATYARATSKRYRSGVGVTAQHDVATVYKRKRMPRSKRGKWVRFVKQVQAVELKTLGTKNYVYNQALTFDNATFEQAVGSVALYGGYASGVAASNQGYNALADLFNVANYPLASNPEQIAATTSLQFTSAVMDVTMRNASTAQTMELDVYEIWCYRNAVWQSNVQTIEQAFADAAGNSTKFTGVGLSPDLSRRGTTPFDIPQFFKTYGFRVMKKKKYILAPGYVATYQIRDARNKVINRTQITENQCFAYSGWTKCLLFLAKNVVNRNAGADGNTLLDVGVTLTYHWKNPLKNDTTTGHN